ncbi:MAG: formylglycine-generating enzyme family protein [Candidatus Omnitrophica bacterium]|nr:formylglycine-generating enzyme family protein [Candidatus Omnitrophota bacterium]
MIGKLLRPFILIIPVSCTLALGVDHPLTKESQTLQSPSNGKSFFGFSSDWRSDNPKSVYDTDDNERIDARDLIDMVESARESTKGLGIGTATIPSGTYFMGNSGSQRDQEYSFSSEFPRHAVTIRNRFEIGLYEITNRRYADALNQALEEGELRDSGGGVYAGGDVYLNGRRLIVVSDPYCDIKFLGGAFIIQDRDKIDLSDHPVCFVTWYGAIAFCNWLSEVHGLPVCYDLLTWTLINPSGGGFRLPSEAEWEYACRGPESNPNRYAPYFFGDDIDLDLNSCDRSDLLAEYMVTCTNSRGWTEEVGLHRPNPYGLYDINGNVWEWCQDAWHDSYQGAPADDSPWEVPVSNFRVVRGGSWTYRPQQCRSASRDYNAPNKGDFFIGFRVVRVPQ